METLDKKLDLLKLEEKILDFCKKEEIYSLIRTGSLTLHPHKGKSIHLSTVPSINKLEEKLDKLISRITVEVDDLDKTPE